MGNENLFENITLEEAKAVLQEVSERMDEAIKNVTAKGYWGVLIENDVWNLAHDVLEIIHSPKVEEQRAKSIGELTLEIKVDTTELDEALEKYEEIQGRWDDEWERFKSLESDEARIFVLVSKHGWGYQAANNFILHL